MKSAPMEYNGKRLVFQETFVSPFEKDSRDDALRVLEAIRANHPDSAGWLEIYGGTELLSNGKWRAVRHHAQYR